MRDIIELGARSELLLRPREMDRQPWLPRAIWLYLFLLIFEGALRKWVVPQLSGQLLVIRDPVVLVIYALALARGSFPRNGLLLVLLILGMLSVAASVLADGANLGVVLFGFHASFLHLPLVFVIGQALSREEVVKLGRAFLWLTPVVAILMILQFLAPPDSILNRGTTGEGGQIESALGKIRPAALFSYNTGAGQFLAISTAYVLFAIMTKRFPQWLFYTAGLSIIMALAVSGSRTSVTSALIVATVLVPIWLVLPHYWSRFGAVAVATAMIAITVAHTGVFRMGVEVLGARIEGAGETEGGLAGFLKRAADGYGLTALFVAPLLGYGLGMGTNVGAQLLTGELRFLLAEGEWSRVILESGPVLGLAYLVCRVVFVCQVGRACWQALCRGEILPILLFGASALLFLNGQFGQATTLGFAVFGLGLALAAAKAPGGGDDAAQPTAPSTPTRQRGRSLYADRLHPRS